MPKFKDIKQYPKAYYDVDVQWTYLQQYLSLLEDKEADVKVVLNPDFQRGHVWNEAQQIKYIEAILQGYTGGKDLYFNAVGFPNIKEDILCIDGLQRITAVKSFLNNNLPIFDGHYYKDYEDGLHNLITSFKIHIGNLETRLDVLRWYRTFNFEGTPHSRDELDKVDKLIEIEKLKRV